MKTLPKRAASTRLDINSIGTSPPNSDIYSAAELMVWFAYLEDARLVAQARSSGAGERAVGGLKEASMETSGLLPYRTRRANSYNTIDQP